MNVAKMPAQGPPYLHCAKGRFEAFAAVTQGWHDGTRANVTSDAVFDATVVAHEYVHERILTTTPDGQLLSAVWQILSHSTAINPRQRRLLESIARDLIKVSRRAHETVATYVGIKLAGVADEAERVAQLPPDYRRFYRLFQAILDPLLRSSYVQVLVAFAIADVVFASPLLPRYAGLDRRLPLCDEESADVRLANVTATIKAKGVALGAVIEVHAQESFTRLGFSDWDLQSDAAWEANRGKGAQLEHSLSPAIRAWLGANSELSILSDQSYEDGLATLRTVMAAHGIQFEIVQDSATDNNAGTEAYRNVIEWWQSDSRVINTRAQSLDEQAALRPLATLDPALLIAFAIISAEQPDHLDHWYVLGHARDQPLAAPAAVARLDRATALEFVAAVRDRERAGERLPYCIGFVLAVHDLKDLHAQLEAVYENVLIVDSTGKTHGQMASVLTLYWVSNWRFLLEFLASDENHKLMGLTLMPERLANLRNSDEPPTHAIDQATGIWVKVVRIDGAQGYYIRALNYLGATALARTENMLRQAQSLEAFDHAEGEFAAETVRRSMHLVSRFWKSY